MSHYNVVLSCDHPGCNKTLHLKASVLLFNSQLQFRDDSLNKAAVIGWSWPGGTCPGDTCFCPMHGAHVKEPRRTIVGSS